jgi:effector-binding domain-containing protein
MTVFRKLLVAAGGLIALILAVGVFLPSSATVERTAQIDAHAATVFALVNDLQQVRKWSPWIDADPNIKIEMSGERRGRGAVMDWSGPVAGVGRQTVAESVPYQRVGGELVLGDHATATYSITLSESDGATLASWIVQRRFGMSLFGRYLGLMMDDVVGSVMEAGLANLGTLAVSLPRADFSDLDVEEMVVQAEKVAFLTASSMPQPEAISEATGAAYFNILRFIDKYGLQEAGAPLIVNRGFTGSKMTFDAGIPVRGTPTAIPAAGEKVRLSSTYAGPVIRVHHTGAYADLARTHRKIAAYLAALGVERNGDAWESYVSDPARTAEADLVTYVYYPVRR